MATAGDGGEYQIVYDGAKTGDTILVHGNLALRRVTKSEAREINGYSI